MANLIIISWRDIPAQVVCRKGRETAKVPLSARFQEAVDRAAMRAGRRELRMPTSPTGSAAIPGRAVKTSRPRSPPRPRGSRRAIPTSTSSGWSKSKGMDPDAAPDGAARNRPVLMYAVRQWSVRHARGLNSFYRGFERALTALHPVFQRIGYQRLERPWRRSSAP